MDLHQAIQNLYSSDTVQIHEIEISEDGLTILAIRDIEGNDVAFNMDDINAEAQTFVYQEYRQTAYPSIQEQLDMMYHDQMNGTTTWKDAITQVKTDNPKPTE